LQGTVISVKPADKKGSAVKIELSFGGEKRIYTVSEGTYREIGCPLSDELIDADSLELLEREHRRRCAMKKALNILAYADNNSKNLYRKLLTAGFSREEASITVKECIRLGYIDEERQLERLIIGLWERDLLGPARIYAKLCSKGYNPSQVSAVMGRLRQAGEIDFGKSRRALIEKRMPETYEERQKILYKYGYKNETD
jgi:SOS response regulatory protein OraA/RecX